LEASQTYGNKAAISVPHEKFVHFRRFDYILRINFESETGFGSVEPKLMVRIVRNLEKNPNLCFHTSVSAIPL